MTPEETKAAAQVMLAAEYDESGRCTNIEVKASTCGDDWLDVSFPTWGWHENRYRIKPKPELKKGQIIEVKDSNGHGWFLRRFSQWATGGRVFAYDGSNREQHDCIWQYWRLPE